MLELVKAQKFPKAAGAEDTFIIDPHKLGETMYSEWGKYVDHANHEVSEIVQKFAWFNAGLSYVIFRYLNIQLYAILVTCYFLIA